MKKQVSPAQIEMLFKFMRQKYVRYYDVQIELVDHFASAIESMWEKNPSMTFEQGIDKVYAEFPITGFNNLIQEKTAVLNKKIETHAWKEVKAYLQLPKIMLTFLCCTILYLLFKQSTMPLVAACALVFGAFFISTFHISKLKKSGSKKANFLVLNTLMWSQGALTSMEVFFQPMLYTDIDVLPNWFYLPLSIGTTLLIIGYYGHYKVACSMFEEWKVQYPQFL